MILEDLNPRLFNALGAAAASLSIAQHEEHVAQGAISGRRYLEQLADALFPERDVPYKGRAVGKDKYRNRLWAFISDNAPNEKVSRLGDEVDRLVEEFNAAVHSDKEKDRIMRALADASELTAAILTIDPKEARKPYLGHESKINECFQKVLKEQP